MIEKIIIDYLKTELTVPVVAEQPKTPSDSFVLIEKTGSSERNHTRSATMAIQSYSTTLLNAATLNEEVISKMREIVKLPSIGSCFLNSDYNFTDETTKIYRYQAVFELTYY